MYRSITNAYYYYFFGFVHDHRRVGEKKKKGPMMNDNIKSYITISKMSLFMSHRPEVYHHVASVRTGRVGFVKTLCGMEIDLEKSNTREFASPPTHFHWNGAPIRCCKKCLDKFMKEED